LCAYTNQVQWFKAWRLETIELWLIEQVITDIERLTEGRVPG